MTCYLAEESQSSLKDGIETVVIPIHDPNDMEQLVFHTQRGGVYDVVEWLLSELYRQTELERVVGLTVTPNHNQVVVNLELRQPGLQMEEWIRDWSDSQGVSNRSTFSLSTNNGSISAFEEGEGADPVLWGTLCSRALSSGKFTDQYHPWWEAQVTEIMPQLEQEVSTG